MFYYVVFVQQHFIMVFVYLEFIAVGKRKDTAAETTNSNVVEIGMLNDILCSVSEFV